MGLNQNNQDMDAIHWHCLPWVWHLQKGWDWWLHGGWEMMLKVAFGSHDPTRFHKCIHLLNIANNSYQHVASFIFNLKDGVQPEYHFLFLLLSWFFVFQQLKWPSKANLLLCYSSTILLDNHPQLKMPSIHLLNKWGD